MALIENHPANSLLAGFNDDELRQVILAIDRAETIERARTQARSMGDQARAIESDIQAQGISDPNVLREAREAVTASSQADQALGAEFKDYQQLFGLDGRTGAAVSTYVLWMRGSVAGDQQAIDNLQGARRELDEARTAMQERDKVVPLRPGQQESENQVSAPDHETPERKRRVELERTPAEELAMASPAIAPLHQDLSTTLPADFVGRYVRDGNRLVTVGDANHVLLTDKGKKLHLARDFDAEAVKAAVDIGEARGWANVTVKGDEKFRQAVWYEATTRGIEVKGYTPTEQEKEWASKQAERAGRANVVAENPAVKAFLEAKSPADRKQAAEAHPELRKAFAAEAAYSKLARQIQGEGAQQAFMTRMRDNLALDIAQGRELADVRLRRTTWGREQVQRQERDLDRGR